MARERETMTQDRQEVAATRGALAYLVETRRRVMGKSFRAIATEAGVSVATVHKITSGKMVQPPTTKTLDGLARVLGLDREVLDAAAMADRGVREFVLEEGNPRVAYYGMRELTPDQQEIVLSVIRGRRTPTHQQPVDFVTFRVQG
jgi:transcriptional regulator with XRE-family HTH domain